MSAPPATRVDPITASVIAGALESIAVETSHRLARMSDFADGVLSRECARELYDLEE